MSNIALFDYLSNHSLAYLTSNAAYPDSERNVTLAHAKRLRYTIDKIWYSKLQQKSKIINVAKEELTDKLAETLECGDYNVIITTKHLDKYLVDLGVEVHMYDPDPDFKIIDDNEVVLINDLDGKLEFGLSNDKNWDEYYCNLSINAAVIFKVSKHSITPSAL